MPSSPANEGAAREASPAPPGPGPESDAAVAVENAATAELEAELARTDDRYRRAVADLENFRRRSARDLELRINARTDALLRDWLEVVDSVERSAQMADVGSDDALGLSAVRDQIEAILRREGLERIGARGERFDPDRHEAIGVRESSEPPGHIAEVARSGFAHDGRVLRPAQVIVSTAPGD